MLIDENTVGRKKIGIRNSHILIEMVTGENQPYDHLYLKNCLIPFSANGDHNEMIQNDIILPFSSICEK